MNVLFIGNIGTTSTSRYYFTNLLELGHSVLPFDPKFFVPRNPKERWQIHVKKSPTSERVKAVSDQLVQLCRHHPFDLIFVMSENYLPLATLQEMRKAPQKKPVLLYHSHDNNFSDGILKPKGFFETLPEYDLVFTTKSQNVKKYRDLGQANSSFIPSAYEPQIHQPISNLRSRYGNRRFKVTFVGTYDKSRNRYLDEANWDRLRIWGNGWKKAPKYSRNRSRIISRAIYSFEFADVLSHSKCSLGLLREEAEDLHTQRTFEIPACGSLQIAPRNEEILSFFKEDKEIVCFEEPEELGEKIHHYLNHSEARDKIARAGYARCVRDKHTYKDRVKKMLTMAEKI